MAAIDVIESTRLKIQNRLDAAKTPVERNKLGQFATPTMLAREILEYAKSLLPPRLKVRFLDPAFGTGSFYSALLQLFPSSRIVDAVGYETDPDYGHKAIKLWGDTPLKLNIADFTQAKPPDSDREKANLLICNPPYVRHHHLTSDEKLRLQRATERIAGVRLSGLAGLYCHFLCISHGWMAENGLAGWLIPSEFMDVNYGQQVKKYLLSRVTLLRIHRFDTNDVQFEDALVSSAVVWFRNVKPSSNYTVEFTYGGTLLEPKISKHISVDVLRRVTKWTKFPLVHDDMEPCHKRVKLKDLFHIKRGLATGANEFFLLTPEQVSRHQLPAKFLIPILPSPRYLPDDEIEADSIGNPILSHKLFLLSCNLLEDKVKAKYPSLWKYLQTGVEAGIKERYLCRNRSPWYSQEERPASMFLCTYMGRQGTGNSRPFRFILNHSKATAANVYLMLYPKPALEKALKVKPELVKAVWQALNKISPETLVGEGRVYGGGLYKIEPKELSNAPADSVLEVLPRAFGQHVEQMMIFDE